MRRSTVRLMALMSLLLTSGVTAESPTPSAEQIAFFETKIRPVLAEHCYQCHSVAAQKDKKLKGGLFLDSRSGVLTGGDTGPALIAGNAEKSLLMTALRWQDPDLQMPPKTKLPDAIISDFATWITNGAADPRSGEAPAPKAGIDIAKGRQHWAYQPLASSKPPAVKNESWVRTPIDRFILARQETAGVVPSAPLGREALIRRVSFALRGLPPSPAEVAAFVADSVADAPARLIDRLLAEPAFGEHWSRHWLDVVRYAESGGYEFDGYRPGAYHYRDWVIRSLNADLPYDQFVREQIAGDKLKPGDFDAACATGFLVAGPYPGQLTAKTKERIRYDQLDDMVATIGSSMLGLTIECARCHDHKFDPIPQRDYYALAATLARTEHAEIKLDRQAAETTRRLADHQQRGQPLLEALKTYTEREFIGSFSAWQSAELPKLSATARWQALAPVSVKARNAILEVDGDGHVLNTGKREKKDVSTITAHTSQQGLTAFRIDVFSGAGFPNHGPGLSSNGNFVLGDFKVIAKPHDPKLKTKPITLKLKAGSATFSQKDYPLSAALDNSPDSGWAVHPQTGRDHAATFAIDGAPIGFDGGTDLEFQLTFDHFGVGNLRLSFAAAEPAGSGPVATPAPGPAEAPAPSVPPAASAIPALDDAVDTQHLREIQCFLARSGGQVPEAERDLMLRWFAHFDRKAAGLLAAVRDHERQRPQPDLVDIYATKTGGQDVYLLRRGEVDNKDAKSVPGFLQVLTAGDPSRWQISGDSDPRLGLARWLTDADAGAGRLLARVMANRLWKHLFGKGLIATPNDFGNQGERPSDTTLLDHLAAELIRGGWRLKPLLRQIMLSAVYLQGAEERASNRARDPDNTLWWRRPAMRLEAEAIRDALLSVGGRLDPTMFGPAIEDVAVPRRSVYLRVRRSELFPFLTLFDAPEPTQSNGDRGATTQPTQALALMNAPLVRQASDALRKRVWTTGTTPSDAIAQAYRIALSRSPTADEALKLAAFFAHQQTLIAAQRPAAEVDAQAMTRTCHVVLCLNEFIYVD